MAVFKYVLQNRLLKSEKNNKKVEYATKRQTLWMSLCLRNVKHWIHRGDGQLERARKNRKWVNVKSVCRAFPPFMVPPEMCVCVTGNSWLVFLGSGYGREKTWSTQPPQVQKNWAKQHECGGTFGGSAPPPLVWTKTMCAYFPFLLFTVVASVFCLPFYCFSEWYGLVSADRSCTALNHLQIELCALCVFLERAALDCVVPA